MVNKINRVYKQFVADLWVWRRSRWLHIGSVFLVLLVIGWCWHDVSTLQEQLSEHPVKHRVLPSKAWGILASVWRGIIEVIVLLGALSGALSVATEFGSGRIRTLMSQPLRRSEFFLARMIRSLLMPFLMGVLLLGTSYLFIQYRAGFGPIVDPDFVSREMYSRAAIWQAIMRVAMVSMLCLFVAVQFGSLISCLSRNGTQSLVLTLFGYLFLRLIGTFPAEFVQTYLFTGVLHRILGLNGQLAEGITGVQNKILAFSFKSPEIYGTGLLFVVLFLLSGWLFGRADFR